MLSFLLPFSTTLASRSVVVSSRMPPKKVKKTPAFNPTYALKYGLRISSRHPSTKKVVSVECRFCVAFGRECKVGAKRKATSNIHFFTSFRADQIKAHMMDQHAEKWREYDQSSPEEKESFFDCVRPFKTTLHAHFGGKQTALHFTVNKDIVEVLIGEMLFDPDGDEEVATSRERALAAFVDIAAAGEMQNSDGDLNSDRYGIKASFLSRFIYAFI